MVTRRNITETPGSGKSKRVTNPKPQSDGVAKRRAKNPEPVKGKNPEPVKGKNPEPVVAGDGWYQDEHGAWCFGAGCVAFKIPTDGKPVEVSFEEDCPDEVVDAVTKGARRGTEYYIQPRGA